MDYIAADTYMGRHTVAMNTRKYRVSMWSAEELANLAPEGVIFESFGHVNGVEHFSRTRYVAADNGDLHCYNPEGALTIIHPAKRTLRILTGK